MDKPYFKVWAAEALLSDDLDELTDHERTVWFFLMCVTSLEEPRWTVGVTPNLAKKCKSTPPKMDAALKHMASLGMVTLENNVVTIANASRWNEETERKRKPSDSPEKIRERVTRHRKADETPHVTRYMEDETPDVTPGNAAYKEKEREKEEEREENGVTPPAPPERDLAETVISKLPTSYRHDDLAREECYQFARDYPGMFAETARAIEAVRRQGEACFPRNLRKHMPGWNEPQRNGSPSVAAAPVRKLSVDDPDYWGTRP